MKKRDLIKRREFISSMGAASLGLPLMRIFPSQIQAENRKICIFSKHLQFLPDYTSMAELAAEIGFDGVDLTVRPAGHILPENVENDLPSAVEAVKKTGLDVPMIVTNITAADQPYTEIILKTAHALGIQFYRMGYLSFEEKTGILKSLEKIKSQFAGLIALNKLYQITGAYQNHAGNRVGAPLWDLWWLMKAFDPHWIGCQYDIRHATVEGAYSWPLAMQLLFPFIQTTVIKDFYWIKDKATWKIENCPLGEGMVDFKRYFQYCGQAGISGPISLHVEYDIYDNNDSVQIKRRKTIIAVKRDLITLRRMLNEQSD